MSPLNTLTAIPMAPICKLLRYNLPLATTDSYPFRYCVDSDGEDVSVLAEGAESEEEHSHEEGEGDHDHDHDHEEGAAESGAAGEKTEEVDSNEHCHFHAGVE